MKKVITLFLMLSMFIPTSFSHVYGMNGTTEEGISVLVIVKSQHGGTDRSGAILATIDGHYLSVVFLENLGQVTVEVTRLSGGETQIESTPTPTGVNFYMSSTGSYMVTFTLSNGDEYYGEFEVTD